MTINAGVWIDHHKAVVVLITDEREDILNIMSDPDELAQSPGGGRGTRSFTPSDFVAEDKRERKTTIRLNKYYDDVIACLRDAEVIVVLGPGEAKGEFTHRFKRQRLHRRIAHMGTVDKMTDRQIAAHVRQLLGISPRQARSTETQRT